MADELLMQVFFFFILSFVFSHHTLAMTLGEVGAAAGIASTLQGTAQTQPKDTLDKVKQTVQNYEQIQQQQMEEAQNISAQTVSSVNHPTEPQSVSSDFHNVKHLTKEELDKRFDDEGVHQKTNPVDYKAQIQIFYKKKCLPSQKDCNRGAVLTNIKSVIFNYAHTRGSFAKSE